MQVNKEEIKRLSLIEPFFNEELTPENEFVTYIDCTNYSTVAKKDNATPDSHNIKKSLKTKKFNVAVSAKYNHTRLSMNDNGYILLDGSIYDYDEYLRGVRLNMISAIPQPHNNALSLV